MPENEKPEVIKTSKNNDYTLIKIDDCYFIMDNSGDEPHAVGTPRGDLIKTMYFPIAERLFSDIQKYGPYYMSAESLLPWHYTLCENFIKMEHEEIEEMLDECFLQEYDWTFEYVSDEKWKSLFGEMYEREPAIRNWLSKCTHMQMTAACCIGNAYHSLNVAFVLANLMENFTENERKKQFEILAKLMEKKSLYGPASNILKDFENFNLYYGIHLDEKGPIINNKSICLTCEDDENNEYGFEVTEEILIGRNYYHYTYGEKDDEQSFVLNHDILSCLSEYDEDDDEEEVDNELADYVPDDCWIKRICATDDDGEAYYIVAVEVKNNEVVGITTLLDEVYRAGGGLFFIPGKALSGSHSYEEVDADDYEAIENEIKNLKRGRYLSKDFSFVGKILPNEIIVNDKYNGDDTCYLICLQSAHRLAYMDLFINTDEKGVVENFEYTTYQSTGSGYGDLFSRPQALNDKNEEAIDMLLYITDKYTDEEYESIKSGE